MNNDDKMETGSIGGSNFKFSGIRTEHLGASEYTLVNIGVDVTGSTYQFTKELRDCLVAAVTSCQKSPRADNLLIRAFLFATHLPGGIEEIHGFKPLSEIDANDYPELQAGAQTNLFDAAYSAVGATNAYAEQLAKDDFPCNAINFIITDGEDNASTMTASAVKREIEKGIKNEELESCINVLIGINAKECERALTDFKEQSGFDHYIDAGDVSPQKLAKLAAFVSQSVSSQSSSLGTGGPSQNISATI